METFKFKYRDRFDRNWSITCNISEDDIIAIGYDIDNIELALASICNKFIASYPNSNNSDKYLLFNDDDSAYIYDIKYTVHKTKSNKRYINNIRASLFIATAEEREIIEKERQENERREKEEAEKRKREYDQYISQFISVNSCPKYEYKNSSKNKKYFMYQYGHTKLLRWQNDSGEVRKSYYFGNSKNLRKLTQEFDNLVDNILTIKDIQFIANHSMYGEAYYHAMKSVNRKQIIKR